MHTKTASSSINSINMSNIEDMDCAKENLDRLHARIDAILTLCEGYFLSVSSNSLDSKRSIHHSEDAISRILSIAAGEKDEELYAESDELNVPII